MNGQSEEGFNSSKDLHVCLYCSQGHINSAGSRFCSLCGEKLTTGTTAILGDRYSILQELGQGGFGRTYLATDSNRFNELCVLKEFAPQVRGTYALQKSEELFEREAGVLYKLRHPQIPQFRELFRAALQEQDYLFLVQDYVAGYTYRQLLEERRLQGFFFSEWEIQHLLEQVLPVLHYIHAAGVIHRDISPDNLILRSSDQLPVLIDFGGVKHIAAEAESQFVASREIPYSATRLGKVGYAPQEQMQEGIVSPSADLYALAVTALVLLTGKEPAELLGAGETWQPLLSARLVSVLRRMLAFQPGNRYQSAEEVLLALGDGTAPDAANLHTIAPRALPPIDHTELLTPDGPVRQPAPQPVRRSRRLPRVLLVLALLGGAGWWTRSQWLPRVVGWLHQPAIVQPLPMTLRSRCALLGVDYQFLVGLTNATFYDRYPDQKGHTLTDAENDAKWRAIWNSMADHWLTTVEQTLSPQARHKLGSYTSADRENWKREVSQFYVGSRSLFDLTDAQFFHLFPRQRGKEFINQPIGQIWQAIAADQVTAMQARKTLEDIQFKSGAYSQQTSGHLAAGGGKVYTIDLVDGQILRVNVQAPERSTLVSVYLPRPSQEQPFLLADSPETTWSDRLPQSGYYEVVVINHSTAAIDYQLNLAVDNVISTPVSPEDPGAKAAKD